MLADLDEGAAAAGEHVVLFWDEFPLFLRDVAREGSPQEAMQLLDRLRAARARHTRLRMVLNGSISFDEVLGTLRRQGYANDPFNDMAKERVPVLDREGALVLARALVRGTGIDADLDTLPPHLVQISEGHPFILQHLVHGMRYAGALTRDGADEQLDRLIDAENDPLELRHFLQRLEVDADGAAADLARAVLDRVARAGEISGHSLLAFLPEHEPERVRDALQRLRVESYLLRSGDHYRFSFEFLRTWWQRERAL